MPIVYPNSMQSDCISEMWRMTTSFTGAANPMTNWERADDVGSYSPYNSSTSNSLLINDNGIFTFREKGGYLINYFFMAYHTQASRYNVMNLELSWNNGANYDHNTSAYGSFPDANSGYSGTHEQTGTASNFLAIPGAYGDGSGTRKIKFKMQVQNSGNGTYGSSTTSYTGFIVSKLTDHTHAPS